MRRRCLWMPWSCCCRPGGGAWRICATWSGRRPCCSWWGAPRGPTRTRSAIGCGGLGVVRDTVTTRILRRDPVAEYTLDADAMQVEAEKRDAQWTYQKVQGYMPMLGFLFESGLCLLDEFREGHVSPQTDQLGFYRRCQQRLPVGKRLARYRADSASYRADLINALEDDGVTWAITADQDVAVNAAIQALPEAAWMEPVVGCGYAVAETVHTMNATRRAFRLIVKRWLKPQPSLLGEPGAPCADHAVASNWPA